MSAPLPGFITRNTALSPGREPAYRVRILSCPGAMGRCQGLDGLALEDGQCPWCWRRLSSSARRRPVSVVLETPVFERSKTPRVRGRAFCAFRRAQLTGLVRYRVDSFSQGREPAAQGLEPGLELRGGG